MLRLWGESSLAERFNDIGRKLLSPAYDPKADRQPTADEALDAELLPDDREVDTMSATAKVQPKNMELAALEQTVQKSAKQGTLDTSMSVCVVLCLHLSSSSSSSFVGITHRHNSTSMYSNYSIVVILIVTVLFFSRHCIHK